MQTTFNCPAARLYVCVLDVNEDVGVYGVFKCLLGLFIAMQGVLCISNIATVISQNKVGF